MTSLRNKASKAFIWDLLGNYGGQVSYFVITVFLARLLSPVEFGLVGMSMVFIAILNVFKDLGFASALIQNPDNTKLTYSSVFWVNIIAGALLTLLVFLAAPLIGWFYENDQIIIIVRLLSFTFLLSSLNIVQVTILKKRLNFKRLTLIQLGSLLFSGIIAIAAAYWGLGVFSLVIQQLLAILISMSLLWKVSEWKPSFDFSKKEVKKLTGFSVYVFFGQFVNQIFKQLDTLIVGKLFSPATLGFFSRAESINSLISKNSVSTFNRVFFPVLSTIRDDDERFEKIFLKVLNIVSTISIFLTGVFFLSGEELIIFLFGEKWQPSVFIFEVLIIKGFSYPISAMVVNAFFAKGKSKENFHYGNIRRVTQLIQLGIAWVFGFNAFLYAIVGVSIFNWLLNTYFVRRTLGISFWSQIALVLKPLIVAAILVLMLSYLLPSGFSYLLSITAVSLFSFGFIVYVYFFEKNLVIEIQYYFKAAWNKFGGYLKKR